MTTADWLAVALIGVIALAALVACLAAAWPEAGGDQRRFRRRARLDRAGPAAQGAGRRQGRSGAGHHLACGV